MALIRIEIGPVTAQRSWSNNVKVADTLRKYAETHEITGETDQETLLAVIDHLVDSVIVDVRHYEANQRQSALIAQMNGDIETEFDFREGA